MSMSFFGLGRRKRASAAVPEGSRVYAIGDIHGRVDLLRGLHEAVLRDAAAHDDRRRVVVYLGDYVDRGMQTREVIDCLLDAPLPGFEAIHLKGNHEACMLDFLDDAIRGAGWLEIGGNATLFSYGVKPDDSLALPARLADASARLARNLPDRHRAFFESLALHHEEGDFLFVHAGLRPRVPLAEQREADLLWIRDDFLRSTVDHGKVVVHGHSVSWEPDMRKNRICVDTGAFASGVLTALVLHGTDRRFLQTGR